MTGFSDSKEILRRTRLLATAPDQILDQVADVVETLAVKGGDVILTKGELGREAYIIVEGRVRVHDGDVVLNYLGAGDMFGEMAALDHHERSATITAEADTRLMRLDSEALCDLIAKRRDAALTIVHGLCESLRDRVADITEDVQQIKALERELEIGRDIQAGFLPRTLPQPPGWQLAARLSAAREVAGDYYDAFVLTPDNALGLVIGDVCDKGVGAALFMTLFRSLIRAGASEGVASSVQRRSGVDDASVAALLNGIALANDYVARVHGHTGMFSTLFFAALDPATGILHYVNAGHEPPFIVAADGVRRRLETTGPVLGLFPGADFSVGECRLEPGETLFAYTDGVTEAQNMNGELFGEHRLQRLLVQPDTEGAAVIERVQAALNDFADGRAQFDDITMFVAAREPH